MNFNYIPLHASTKIPLHKNWANKYQTEKPSGNYGVLTGKINNIIIVDIDNKDDGLTKWEELIETHNEPLTYTIKTGSGGYHYYFNYNDIIKNIIKLKIDGISYLTNNNHKSKLTAIKPSCKIICSNVIVPSCN